MKDIEPKLVNLFKTGFCTPQISSLAKKLKEPSTTIHYNIKRLEKEGKIKNYKAVFDYKKLGQEYCSFVFVNLSSENYSDPEKIASEIAQDGRVESVDICTGDYELIIKLRTSNVDEYYSLIKSWMSKFKFRKTSSVNSLKQIKSEFDIL